MSSDEEYNWSTEKSIETYCMSSKICLQEIVMETIHWIPNVSRRGLSNMPMIDGLRRQWNRIQKSVLLNFFFRFLDEYNFNDDSKDFVWVTHLNYVDRFWKSSQCIDYTNTFLWSIDICAILAFSLVTLDVFHIIHPSVVFKFEKKHQRKAHSWTRNTFYHRTAMKWTSFVGN